MRKINWKRGNATLILGTLIMMLAVTFAMLISECSNLYWCNTVVVTRTDAIADGSAVYAQSYDFKLNKPQAQIMAAMLTAVNDDDRDRYKLFTNVSFESDIKMTVKGTTSTDFFYPSFHDTEEYMVSTRANVEVLDVYGDILVVPGEKHDS